MPEVIRSYIEKGSMYFPELPSGDNYDADKFKLYFGDTGLLISLLYEEAGEDLRANKNLGVYKGALYENIMAEAMRKSGYNLYYYRRNDSTLEQDFFIRSSDYPLKISVIVITYIPFPISVPSY